MFQANKQHQRGSTALGVIVGVLIGLGVALGVAVYVMKVPTPFNSKSSSRTAAQDAAEAKKNKEWDPNAAIAGKPINKSDTKTDTPLATPTKPQATPNVASKASLAASPLPAGPSPTSPAGDGVVEYYVQAGAFRNNDEAQTLRGKLALSNFDGKVVERDQSGQTVYRVRVGPFASLAIADKTKANMEAAGFDAVVMRTQR